jgi:transcription elongation GreA/GreB family factor
LVSPSEENKNKNKISVLSVLGSNLLGAAVDDSITIENLTETLKIIKVEKLAQRSLRFYSGVEF